MAKPKKQAGRRITNPTGKGGFNDHPELICRDGAAKSTGRAFQVVVREWLEAGADVSSEQGKSRVECLLEVLWEVAMSGAARSVDAVELLLNRGYGKAVQSTELSGPNGTPLLPATISDTVARLNGDLTAARADVASEVKQD